MTEYYRQFVKLISTRMRKYRAFDNAKGIVEDATQTAQNKFSDMRNVASEKYNIIAKKLNNQAVVLQDLNAKALQPSVPLPEKIMKWWQWYNQLTGLNTVEVAKRQVIVVQDKLFECQDNRRTLNKEFTDITFKLQEITGELVHTRRDDPRYVNLTIMENKCLQEQKKVMNRLTLSERDERDHFTQLATAIKEYHDSQNLNAQKYKYLSILASAVIAIVSLIGSMILNNQRILDVRNVITVAQEKNELLHKTNTNELSEIKKIFHSLDIKLSQVANINKGRENKENDDKINKSNTSSNILITSVNYSAQLLVSGMSYIKRGIYACGSYIFYK